MNNFKTAFQFYLPEDLGFIDNISVHLQIGHEISEETKIWHIGRYVSINGNEWEKVFNNANEEITQYHTLKSSSFSFPIEIWDYIEGSFYVTFTGCKDGIVTPYHTEKTFFKKIDKLIVYR